MPRYLSGRFTRMSITYGNEEDGTSLKKWLAQTIDSGIPEGRGWVETLPPRNWGGFLKIFGIHEEATCENWLEEP